MEDARKLTAAPAGQQTVGASTYTEAEAGRTGTRAPAAPGLEFPAETCDVPPSSRLLLFSDGVFEILRNDRLVWSFQELLHYFQGKPATDHQLVDHLLAHVRALRGADRLDDDLSIIDAYFE